MKGKAVEKLVHVLDRAAGALGRENPAKLPQHLLTGRRGEDEAYFYLRRQGYVIVARNWRSPGTAANLIWWDGTATCSASSR
jgi:putative endonuclease